MTKEQKQDFTRKISQANKTQLVVISYEMALVYLQEAQETKERTKFRKAIAGARGCIYELMNALDFDYVPAQSLLNLYLFSNRELFRADIKNITEPVKSVQMIFKELHAAFSSIASQDTSGSVMENTQTVYAGLTYGRNQLNESLSNQGVSRGFLI